MCGTCPRFSQDGTETVKRCTQGENNHASDGRGRLQITMNGNRKETALGPAGEGRGDIAYWTHGMKRGTKDGNGGLEHHIRSFL